MDAILALLVVLTAVVVLWFDSAGARERARALGKATCRRLGVQLLDDTVGLRRLRVGRNPQGRVCLVREFGFEFSPDGATRLPGMIRLRGRRADLFMLQREGHREYLSGEQVANL